jgi:hypothetical protein
MGIRYSSRQLFSVVRENTRALAYPRNLVTHAGESKVDPVGNGSATYEPYTGNGHVWATLCYLSAHLSLIHWNRAGNKLM